MSLVLGKVRVCQRLLENMIYNIKNFLQQMFTSPRRIAAPEPIAQTSTRVDMDWIVVWLKDTFLGPIACRNQTEPTVAY